MSRESKAEGFRLMVVAIVTGAIGSAVGAVVVNRWFSNAGRAQSLPPPTPGVK